MPAFADLQPQGQAAIRHDDRKLIVRPFATPTEQLFDLRADPAELVDRAATDPATASALQQELRACVQCTHFDPSARFECSRPITARVSPKDAANECPLFEARTGWERETTAATGPPASGANGQSGAPSTSARKAFDDLFKI